MTIGKYTGASLNPARVLGPAAFNSALFKSGFWVYYTAPIAGGVAGGVLYDLLILKSHEEIEEFKEKVRQGYQSAEKKKIRREIELSVTENYAFEDSDDDQY